MRYTQWRAFQKHLESAAPNHLSHCYLVALEEEYERHQLMGQIARAFSSDPLRAQRYVAKDLPLLRLREEFSQCSLLTDSSLFLIDGLQELSLEAVRSWSLFLSQVPLSRDVLILGVSTKHSLISVAETKGVVLDLSEEKGWEKEKRLKEWAIEHVERAHKRWESEALELFFTKLEKKGAFVTQEVEKLLLFVGERVLLTIKDVQAISSSSLSYTLWQIAEKMVWERAFEAADFDPGDFQGLLSCLRTQMQLGLKIADLKHRSIAPSKEHFPNVWPRVLEKRIQQVDLLGASFFQKGLETLFQLELLSRSGSLPLKTALDLLCCKWRVHAAR